MDQGAGTWIALTVKPLKERLACHWLSFLGVEHTLPYLVRLRRRSRHQKAKPKPQYAPAMRGYVFVFVPDGQSITNVVARARLCPSIVRPVAIRGKPLALRESNWELKLNPKALDRDGAYERPVVEEIAPPAPPPPLGYVPGDRVRLTEAAGYFSGYTGRVDNIKGDEVSLAIEGLQLALLTVRAEAAIKLAA